MHRSTHSISSPGDNSAFAYEYDQNGPLTPDPSANPASLSQQLLVSVGQAYRLTFRTYFDACTTNEGFVGVMLNQVPVYTVDACDFGAGAFKDNTVSFTAASSPLNLVFQFKTGEIHAVVKIDNVVVVPVSSVPPTVASLSVSSSATTAASTACGSPVIQNGGFESGALAPWVVSNQVGTNSYSIVKPGSTNPGGDVYAFQANLQTPNSPYAGVCSLTLSQTLSTCAGTNYSISVDFKLDANSLGPCSIEIDYPYKSSQGSVTESSAVSGAGWHTLGSTFQAVSNADVFRMVLSCTAGGEDIEVDNVKIQYFAGNAY